MKGGGNQSDIVSMCPHCHFEETVPGPGWRHEDGESMTRTAVTDGPFVPQCPFQLSFWYLKAVVT